MRREVETVRELETHLAQGGSLSEVILKGVDLVGHSGILSGRSGREAILLGCHMDPELHFRLFHEGALLFPRIEGLPFEPYRTRLYSPLELLGGSDSGETPYAETVDGRIYAHYLAHGGADCDDLLQSLAQRIHDYSMTDAYRELIEGERVVAIMGGHSIPRTDPAYENVARVSRELSRRGCLMASGGGPGAMEATHLGALLAQAPDSALSESLRILSVAPGYEATDEWLNSAWEVVRHVAVASVENLPTSRTTLPTTEDDDERHPLSASPKRSHNFESLGIPTWLYGHEPPTVFATHIAKFFANSVREDGLLTVAQQGIVFTPGSAGTIQEIFQDATQNHYETHGFASPMVFLGREFWTRTKPVYPLLRELSKGRPYHDLVRITDDVDEVVEWITAFTPPGATTK